jgi:hypothetical protein
VTCENKLVFVFVIFAIVLGRRIRISYSGLHWWMKTKDVSAIARLEPELLVWVIGWIYLDSSRNSRCRCPNDQNWAIILSVDSQYNEWSGAPSPFVNECVEWYTDIKRWHIVVQLTFDLYNLLY